MWYCLILEGIWRVFFLYNPFCQFLIPNFSVWSTQALINWNQSNHSFIPGLPHSFHRLQYGNARRAWYIVSHGHDVSDKMVKQKVTKAKFRAFLLWMTAVVVSLLFHLFYPHTTHMRLCTTTLTGFLYCKQWRAGQTRVMKAMDVEMAAEWGYLLTRKLYTCYPWNSSTRNYVIYVMLAKSCFETHLVLKFILLRSIMLSDYLNSHTCWTGTSKSEAMYW